MDDSSKKPAEDKSPKRFLWLNLWQIVLLFIVAFIFALPSVISYARNPSVPKVGDIAQENIIAPVQFEVLKDPDSLESEQHAVMRAVPEVLIFDSDIRDSVLENFDRIWKKTAKFTKLRGMNSDEKVDSLDEIWNNSDKSTLEHLTVVKGIDDFGRIIKAGLKIIYNEGFVSSSFIRDESMGQLFGIRKNGSEEVLPTSMVMTDSIALVELEQYFNRQFRDAEQKVELALIVAKEFIVPNLIFNAEITETNRKHALGSISPTKMIVSKGEKIIGKHEKIDHNTHLKLISLNRKLAGHSRIEHPLRSIMTVLGTLLISLIVMLLFGAFVYQWYRAVWDNVALFGILIGAMIFVAASAHVLHIAGLTNYAIPTNFVAALLALLFIDWLPFASALVCVVMIGIGFSGSAVYMISAIISASVVAFGTQKVHVRNTLYIPILYGAIAGTVTVMVFNYALFTPLRDTMSYVAQFAIASLFSPFLAYLVLQPVEKISKLSSGFTLLDLADINSMLLQKLAVEAPGTFHHSIMVGNMAAAAAESVGASAMLARVGGYYHDIGKLVNPEYFDENQTGRNVHDAISPFESYRIISSHTTEGVELGKLHRLPNPIIDIIAQHHGTSVIEYFYRKAVESNPSILRDQFRYPGPKPRTIEATIVMICDAVEAAGRSRNIDFSISDERLSDFVSDITNERLNDGQFDEAPISVMQIKKVIERIVPILRGAHHRRVPLDTKPIQTK